MTIAELGNSLFGNERGLLKTNEELFAMIEAARKVQLAGGKKGDFTG